MEAINSGEGSIDINEALQTQEISIHHKASSMDHITAGANGGRMKLVNKRQRSPCVAPNVGYGFG